MDVADECTGRFGTVGEISVIVHFIKVRIRSCASVAERIDLLFGLCFFPVISVSRFVGTLQVGLPYLLGTILLFLLLRKFL